MLLEGKVAIITGASRGIGKAIAQEFVSQGATVAFTYRSSEEKARALEAELTSNGGIVRGFKSDAAEMDQAEALVSEVVEAFGTVNIVVNNAGINIRGPIGQLSYQDFKEVQKINVDSVWLCCKAVIPQMKENGKGRIIIMTDNTNFRAFWYGTNRILTNAIFLSDLM